MLKLMSSLAALLSAVLVWASPGVATASVARSFDISTALGGPHAGQARAIGTVTFQSAKTVVIAGRIRDVCPADGAGAYLQVRIVLEKSINNVIFRSVGADANGCGPDGVGFSMTLPNDGYPIRALRLILSEGERSRYCSDTDCNDDFAVSNPYV